MQELLNVAGATRKASEIIGYPLNRSTVRGWTTAEEFAPFWSEFASPEPGSQRKFTRHDIYVVAAIAKLREENLSRAEVAERLTGMVEELKEPQEPPRDPPDTPGTAIAPVAMQYDLSPIVTATNANSTRLSTVEQRLAAVEAQRVNLHAIIAAFALGMLTIAIAVAIAVAMIR